MSGREAALRQQQQLQERRDDPEGGEGAGPGARGGQRGPVRAVMPGVVRRPMCTRA